MSDCGKVSTSAAARTRELIAGLFAAGQVNAAAVHRRTQCYHASKCGRLCLNLIKGPGLQVWCYNPETGERLPLYESLQDPDFKCPLGCF